LAAEETTYMYLSWR